MVKQKDGILRLSVDTTSVWKKLPEWLNNSALDKYGIEIKDGSMQLEYITSCIWSKRDFKYGYFECRCKAPKGKGLWPAFWLYGQNSIDEIDIMEMKGEKHFETHVDVHCPNNGDKTRGGLFGLKKDWGGWIKMHDKLTDNWVVFSGLWLPNSLTYFVNGIPVSHFDRDFSTSMNVIANLSAARDNGPFSPGPDKKTIFPNEFLVDYIRVWQPISEDKTEKAEAWEFAENTNMIVPTINTAKIKRKVKHIYVKKLLSNNIGFISLIPKNNLTYVIQSNGILFSDLSVEIKDKTGIQKRISTSNNTIDLSGYEKGNYLLKIRINGLKTQISIQI